MTFDGPNKLVILSAGDGSTVSVRAMWSRWVEWAATSDNAKFLPAFEQVGGQDIDLAAGTYIPIYAFLKHGWRVRPREASHTLTINDGVLLVDGGGDPFVNTLGSYIVRINFSQPVQAITVDTGGGGGGGLTVDQETMLRELFEMHGLDPAKPLSVSPTARSVGSITQAISDSLGTVTVQRS